MALTLPEGHIPWKRLVTSAWSWTSLLCGTSEWLWEMEGPCRSAESHSEPQSLTPKRFHGQKGVSCMKKPRVRRDSELPGSFAHHCSHRAGFASLSSSAPARAGSFHSHFPAFIQRFGSQQCNSSTGEGYSMGATAEAPEVPGSIGHFWLFPQMLLHPE